MPVWLSGESVHFTIVRSTGMNQRMWKEGAPHGTKIGIENQLRPRASAAGGSNVC